MGMMAVVRRQGTVSREGEMGVDGGNEAWHIKSRRICFLTYESCISTCFQIGFFFFHMWIKMTHTRKQLTHSLLSVSNLISNGMSPTHASPARGSISTASCITTLSPIINAC